MRLYKVVSILMAAAAIQQSAVADTVNSPEGDWGTDWRIAGRDHGVAILTFADDLTCAGYGYSDKSFGMFPITGSWTVDPKNRVQASMTFDISTGGRAVSTRVNVTNKGRLSAKGRNPGATHVKIRGESPANIPDLTGNWASDVKQDKNKYLESYIITESLILPGVYEVVGTGTGPAGAYVVTGQLMAAPSKKLAGSLISNYGTSMTTTSSVTGRLTGRLDQFRLKGTTDANNNISIKAKIL